jgi:hypothetical protein
VNTTTRQRLALVAQAEAYVRTRFFPPLPAAYGELAVTALEEYRNYGPDSHVNLPKDLALLPRGAERDPWNGDLYVTAAELIRILRIEHMLDDELDDRALVEWPK